MKDERKTVLVTGGAGYVGGHCCKAFAQAGWNIVVYDNLSRGWRDFVKWGDLEEGDILDEARLNDVMARVSPDAVAHFAALAYVGESMTSPDIYYKVNVAGTVNLLNAMRKAGVGQLVFSSTCATYGTPKTIPIDESQEQKPINPYGQSKLMVEKVIQDYSAAFDLRAVMLRYFNAAGADPDGEIGERHEPETHLIPLALQGAGQDDYTLKIFGDDYDTIDGSAVRDYIHVVDLADAHLRALDYLSKGGETAAVNLGTGRGTSVIEIRDSVQRITGRPVKSEIGPRRAGDPPSLVALPEKARALLGWTPTHSGIDEIIADAWRWYQKDANRDTKTS